MARFKTVNDIVNQVALEVGLRKVQDVFAAVDEAFVQMTGICNSVGYELFQERQWQNFKAEHSITTVDTDTGDYDLPSDFAYMINQTGWEQKQNVPLIGPLSPQQWTYLKGRDLLTSTIYASFRIQDGQFSIFPQPPPAGLEITFEYQSRNWADSGTGDRQDFVDGPGNLPLYEAYLFERLLKLRFLQARGFDTTSATDQYDKALAIWGGHDKAAPVLDVGGGGFQVPYLNGLCNTPDTGYGQ